MISIILVGAFGRMGKAVEEAARAADDIHIKARIGRPGEVGASVSGPATAAPVYLEQRPSVSAGLASASAGDELPRVAAAGDVVIEFSSPEGTRNAAQACVESGAALVSGTTGLSPADEAGIREAARRVPVLRAANFSLGVLALRRALLAALVALPKDWDIELVERHHRGKADSPSGTALLLAREAARVRGLTEAAFRFGREGRVGARPRHEIGVHALRGGSWVGDHTVLLAGTGEWLELRHVAQDRSAFAHGVLAAARFVAGATPGLYTLEDVLSHGREG